MLNNVDEIQTDAHKVNYVVTDKGSSYSIILMCNTVSKIWGQLLSQVCSLCFNLSFHLCEVHSYYVFDADEDIELISLHNLL